MTDYVEVRAALKRFSEATGWFLADRNIRDGKASVDLSPAQLDVLTGAVRARDFALNFAADLADLVDGEK